MIRSALVVCLATFGFLISTGQRATSTGRIVDTNIRHDVTASVATSTYASSVVNKTQVRKGSQTGAKRKIWRELLQEIVQMKKSFLPMLMSQSNASYLRFGAKNTDRQLINMIGDLRFVKTEIQYMRNQLHVVWENVTDARRDHKRLSKPIWWIANNMTELYRAMDRTASYIAEFQRAYGLTGGGVQTVAGHVHELTALTDSLRATNLEFGQIKTGIIQGTDKISSEIDGVHDVLRLLGQGVHENREYIVAGVEKLDQSMNAGHNLIGGNISELSSQLYSQATSIAALSSNLHITLNQMSQALNEIGNTAIKVDTALASGLLDMQVRIHDLANLLSTVMSVVKVVQSDVKVMKNSLDDIKQVIWTICITSRPINDSNKYEDQATSRPAPIYPLPPLAPPYLPSYPEGPAGPTTPYPTIPIFDGYPPIAPPYDLQGELPHVHVPDIVPTSPRPMWPTTPAGQHGPMHPMQFPLGPHGPGIPIGFANRFSGYCVCTCPCSCTCPRVDSGPYSMANFFNNFTWSINADGTYNYGVRNDCYCLCTCPCPRLDGIPGDYQPAVGAPPFAPPPPPPPSNGDGIPPTQYTPWFPDGSEWLPGMNEQSVLALLQELMKANIRLRTDVGRIQTANTLDAETTRKTLIDHMNKSFEYLLKLIRSNYDESMRRITEVSQGLRTLQAQMQHATEKATISLELISSKFYQFHKDINTILLSSTTPSTDRLPGYPPIAVRPPSYSPGLQSPEFTPPGSHLFAYGSQAVNQESGSFLGSGGSHTKTITSPPASQSSTFKTRSTDPKVLDQGGNQTDVAEPRMLPPVELEDLTEKVPNKRRRKKSQNTKKCLVIRECIGPVEQYLPLVIAEGVAYPFMPDYQDEPSRYDDDYDIEASQEPVQAAKGSWGIRHTMALPARRMYNGGIFAFHNLFQQHINNRLINAFHSNPFRGLRRKAKSPRPKRRGHLRPRPSRPSRPQKPRSPNARPSVKPSSLLSAASSPHHILISRLPSIISETFGNVPAKITMPGINGPFPYSMSYNDGRGNSFNININRRNNPLMMEAYRATASDKERLKERRCRMGGK